MSKAKSKASLSDGRTLNQRLSSYLLTYRTTAHRTTAHRTTAHSTTGVPPCKLLMQRDLCTRFSLLVPSTEKTALDKQSQQKSSHDHHSRTRKFGVGDRVLVRNHRAGTDWIPATVIEVLGPITYVVETEEGGQRWKRHIDQLKDWLAPASGNAQISPPETESEPFFPSDTLAEPESNSNTAEQIEHDSEETRTPETSETTSTDSSFSTAEDSLESITRRYPARNRQPPDFYQ